jgi:hypothetical protein
MSPYVVANGPSASSVASAVSVRSGRRASAAPASSRTPASANRIPAPSRAGRSSSPILIDTQVLDQMTTSTA